MKTNVIDYFLFFQLLVYGPQIWYASPSGMNGFEPQESTRTLFQLALSFNYILLTSTLFVKIKNNKNNVTPNDSCIVHTNNILYLVLLYFVLTVLFFIIFDKSYVYRIKDTVDFILGSQNVIYTEIRRIIYSSTLSESIMGSTRYSIVPLMFSFIIASLYWNHKFAILKIFFSYIMIFFCATSLSKAFYLYYLILPVLQHLHYKEFNGNPIKVIPVIFIFIVFLSILYFLYTIQYEENIENASLDPLIFIQVIIDRVFNSGQWMLAWFEVYPNIYDHVGFAGSGRLANLFSIQHKSPELDVARLFLDVKTTLQVGYLGSAYASFGFLGILFVVTFVGIGIRMIDNYINKQSGFIKLCILPIIGLNMFWLHSMPFYTVLISGGFISTILFLVLLKNTFRSLNSP